jgi:DNA polymerase III psi subunit
MQSNIENLTEEQIKALTKEQIDADNQHRAAFPKTEPEQFSILRRNDALKTKEQVLELSKQNPCLIALLIVHEIMDLTKEQIKVLDYDQIQALTEEQIKALWSNQIEALEKWQISWLRQNDALKTKEQVLELSKQNPFLIRLLSVDETIALTEEEIAALSYSMQELNVNPTSPTERASSWTEVVAEGTKSIEQEIGKC